MAFPLAAVLMIAGQGMKAFGEYQQSKIESRNLRYQGGMALQDAELIERAGEFEQHKAITARRNLLARQTAIAAASGRDISGGSPLAVMEASERAAIMDEQILAFNKHTAIGRKKSEAALLFGAAKQVKASAKFGIYTSLLGMGTTAAQAGVFKGSTQPFGKRRQAILESMRPKGSGDLGPL